MEVIVILGAAVRPDGSPSPALARRIAYGAHAARAAPEAPVFCSGTAGRSGPSEASVIASALTALGVAYGRLILDEASRDTLQTVVAACRFIDRQGLAGAVACTERYHLPRTLMLFRMLGFACRAGPTLRGSAGEGAAALRMLARESLAYPYDLGVALLRRRALRNVIEKPREAE